MKRPVLRQIWMHGLVSFSLLGDCRSVPRHLLLIGKRESSLCRPVMCGVISVPCGKIICRQLLELDRWSVPAIPVFLPCRSRNPRSSAAGARDRKRGQGDEEEEDQRRRGRRPPVHISPVPLCVCDTDTDRIVQWLMLVLRF